MPMLAPERTLAQKLTPRIFLALRFTFRQNGTVGFETVLAAATCSTEAEAAMRAAGEIHGDAGFFIETDAHAAFELEHGFTTNGRVRVYGQTTTFPACSAEQHAAWVRSFCRASRCDGIEQPAIYRRVL